jgi:multicomponent Na+:H+ antiporter subunit A
VHLVTSLFFDVGVYLVVMGLMLDILRSLGAEVDRHVEEGQADQADEDDDSALDLEPRQEVAR